jgi:hypothetical protein|tara:strand:- start:830 stop:1390 length:561 start_codon:yes stop_codon:yes gene_type:complete
MVQLTNLSKKQTKQDKAIAKTSVDWKTGGLNPPAEYTKNRLKKTENIARTDDENPDFRDFYLNADTFTRPGSTGISPAQLSQQKFNDLNVVNYGDGFPFPADNERIQRFMDIYVDGSSYETVEFDPVTGTESPKMVERLIAYDDAVGPWSLDKFSDRNVMRQKAGDGASKINDNEVNKFPSQGIQV